MSREVRKVPAGYEHPKSREGRFIPLYDGGSYKSKADDFMEKAINFGLQEAIDCCGNPPNREDFMPAWDESEKTHFMMYETTTEGTPISPAFDTPEKLAKWLADTGASSFGSMTATYEQWLRVCNGGFAVSAVYTPETGLVSGVEAFGDKP